MEVPALVEPVDERVADVVGVEAPGGEHRGPVVALLVLGEVLPLVGRDRHDVRRAVGEHHAGAGERDLHHVLGEVARRVPHLLVRGRDVAVRGVVVRAEVRGDQAAGGGAVQPRQDRAALRIEDALRGLDHDLEAQRAGVEAEPILEHVEHVDDGLDVAARLDLGQRDDEVIGQPPVRRAEQLGEEDVERAQRARREVARQRLDADADERRQRAGDQARGGLLRGLRGVVVFLVVGAVAVTVLEVDAEVLDSLAVQLLAYALEHLRREVAADADRLAERVGIGRVGIERAQRELAELLRCLRGEQVRTAVDRVHGLARAGVAGIAPVEARLRAVDAVESLDELLVGNRGAYRHARCVAQACG